MKTVGMIQRKINQVRFRYLKKRIEAQLRLIPGNCQHNKGLPSDHEGRDVPSICTYGVCDPEKEWIPSFCDVRVDGGQRAQNCPWFVARKTKDQVKEEFNQELGQMSFPEIAYMFPDMAALIWVMDTSDFKFQEVEPDAPLESDAPLIESDVPVPTPSEKVVKPWYRRLL